MIANMAASRHLVDDFESAFQNCLSSVTNQEFFNVNDPEETRNSVDQAILRFLDVAKQLECFFLQKRLLLSIHKPEQIVKEDIVELKAELQRKESLIMKHYERLSQWQGLLMRQQGAQPAAGGGAGAGVGGPQGVVGGPPPQGPPPGQQLHPQQQLQQQHQQHQQQQQQQQQAGHPGIMGHPIPPQAGFPQGPLAYLEQTTSNIGMPDRR